MSTKKVIRYIYKLGSESLQEALDWYPNILNSHKLVSSVTKEISKGKRSKIISLRANPKIIKITIEVLK